MKKNDINVPMPGEEPKGRKHGRPDGPHGEKPKKKKKKKHHRFLIIVRLVLIIGILLGILIDRGILFPGGEGWIGGVIGSVRDIGKGPAPIDINGTVTPNPSPVPTNTVDDTLRPAYIRVKGSTIYMNDVEVTAEGLIMQLETSTYEKCAIILLDDGATKNAYENVKTILENKGRKYQEGYDSQVK